MGFLISLTNDLRIGIWYNFVPEMILDANFKTIYEADWNARFQMTLIIQY